VGGGLRLGGPGLSFAPRQVEGNGADRGVGGKKGVAQPKPAACDPPWRMFGWKLPPDADFGGVCGGKGISRQLSVGGFGGGSGIVVSGRLQAARHERNRREQSQYISGTRAVAL